MVAPRVCLDTQRDTQREAGQDQRSDRTEEPQGLTDDEAADADDIHVRKRCRLEHRVNGLEARRHTIDSKEASRTMFSETMQGTS